MGLLNKALIGAAAYFGYKYLTKKDEITGRAIIDDVMDEAPKWVDKAKSFVKGENEEIINEDFK